MGHGVSLDFAEYLLGIELGGDHHGSASTQTGKQPAVPPMMLHWRLNKSNGMLDILKPYGL